MAEVSVRRRCHLISSLWRVWQSCWRRRFGPIVFSVFLLYNCNENNEEGGLDEKEYFIDDAVIGGFVVGRLQPDGE